MVSKVDIKYKNEFWHKGCLLLVLTVTQFQLYRYRNEFWHKACFSLLVLSVRNSNHSTSYFPKLTVKIQIIAEHTQSQCVGTAANYKVLHYYISAQLLLSKHRHSKSPQVLKANQLHHKDI